MKTISYNTLPNKSKEWGPGPWVDEPDKVQWEDTDTGYPCLAVRHPQSGHWCGYVGVYEGHPFFRQDYNDLGGLDVHGGLTFASHCDPAEPVETGVCHIDPGGEEPWWLGFDCAHSGDYSPINGSELYRGLNLFGNTTAGYKDLVYVQTECRKLARRLALVTWGEIIA